ncbi:MAG TPA: hypothetical protein PKY56_01815 [Candidatus Kapabacteria bacterium]|nr:hypothetical protein [Candidatus Kapabacteria bacterium]HPO61465.1 hypothetical protein [Candidatus Kapabacteria bacterium]
MIKIIIAILIVLLWGLGLCEINKNFLFLWNSNSINVTVDKPLIVGKVKVEFGMSFFNSINHSNDIDLFKNRKQYTLLFDGKKQNSIINEYGENDFLISYDNRYYFAFRQFKCNWRHQHDYNFHIYQKKNKLYIQADIKGNDAMKFEKPMLEVSNEDKYRSNGSI